MRSLNLFLMIVLTSLPVQGATRDITAKDLICFPMIRTLSLNEEHSTIIYEKREADLAGNKYRRHLWQVATDGSKNRQLTFSAGNEWGPSVSPSGGCLAFWSDRADEKGEEGQRIWVMPVTGGEARPISDADQNILSFKWSKEGSYIYYLSRQNKPDAAKLWQTEREAAGFDADNRSAEHPRIELWRYDKQQGESKRLFVGDPGVFEFDVHPDNSHMVYATNYTGDDNDWVEADLYLFSLRDSTVVRQLTSFQGAEGSPLFSPGGKYIAFTRPQDSKKPFSQMELDVLSLKGGETKRLTADLDRDISNVSWFSNQSLLVEVKAGMTNHIYAVSLRGSSTALSGGSAYIYGSSVSQGHQSIAALRQTAKTLTEIIYSRGPGHPWLSLTEQSKALEELNIHPQTTFKWASRDNRFILEGLVVLPHFSGTGPLPLIVSVHGGPSSRTDIALEQGGLFQAWASAGFAVFSPNYRGSDGYSNTFQTANYKDLGGGDYQDIRMGIKELIRRGIAHPDSLIIMGGSYGGYMTNWAITQSSMFKAAVSKYGIFDLKNDFSNSIYAQWELDYLGKPYWDAASLYRKSSPSTFIKQAKTPTLILHGASDENTFVSNSRELARALKTLEVPHKLLFYPREGHGMYEPAHRLDVFEKSLSWVNHYLNRPQSLLGEDWLEQDIRVQVRAVDFNAEYLNRPGEKFLHVSLLLDGSRLDAPIHLNLKDFSLEPGAHPIAGLPSQRILTNPVKVDLTLGPEMKTLDLELIFPTPVQEQGTLFIKGIGSFKLLP